MTTAITLPEKDRKKYDAFYNGDVEPVEYATSLAFLSKCLQAYHGENTVILIDEYDVPLENAW